MAASGDSTYTAIYSGERLNHVAFPLGGIGAGMVCLSGAGALTHVSIRGIAEVFNEPYLTAAVCIKGGAKQAKVLEGPVPSWKPMFPRGPGHMGSGTGAPTKNYGLPRFAAADFEARFPFAHVRLSDPGFGLDASICAWSPFIPGDEDASSLPVAALEYTLRNATDSPIEAVFSFHAQNLLSPGELARLIRNPIGTRFRVGRMRNGFVLRLDGSSEEPWVERSFAAAVDDPETQCDYRWFRGDSPFDPFLMVWRHISEGLMPQNEPVAESEHSSPGGSIYVPFRLRAGRMPGTRTAWGEAPAARISRTWAITIPPELRAAWAIGRTSPTTASWSMTRLPRASAAVALMRATSMGKDLYHSQLFPPSSTRSTRPTGVTEFSRPPSRRGSMNVSRPMRVMHPGLPAAMSRKS